MENVNTIKNIISLFTGLLILSYAPLQAQSSATEKAVAESEVVEITASDYAFDAPAEIRSGWSTFQLSNEGEETHFVFLTRLPEGKTFDNYMEEVGVHFNDVWYGLRSGELVKEDASAQLAKKIPSWFNSVVRMGGLGLIEAGATTKVTLQLDPGNYFMECYLKTADGEFHVMEGMGRPLTVTTESTEAQPPEADFEMTLSNDGIEISDDLTAGQHTIAVHFAEHPEVGPQHDVHLAKLDDHTELSKIVEWMDWMSIDGFNSPAPTVFAGGAQEMPVGYTAYLTVDLEPGRYAWISQLTAMQGLVKEFTVEP